MHQSSRGCAARVHETSFALHLRVRSIQPRTTLSATLSPSDDVTPVGAFFYADLGDGLFQCKQCGRSRKQAPGTGYNNLLSHLGTNYAGYVEEYAEFQAAAAPAMGMFGFVDEITLNIYIWMWWTIQRNLPITEVENKLTREMVTMNPTAMRMMKT